LRILLGKLIEAIAPLRSPIRSDLRRSYNSLWEAQSTARISGGHSRRVVSNPFSWHPQSLAYRAD